MQTNSPLPRSSQRLPRLPVVLLLAVACCLLLAANASANSETFKPYFTPYELNQGPTWTSELTFTGTEYYGSVAPLTELTIHLPAGVAVTNAGFPTCEQSTVEAQGPAGCPVGSMAGQQGSIEVDTKFGSEDYKETGLIQPIFAAGEKLLFYIQATAPVDIEETISSSYVTDTAPYGQKLTLAFPLKAAVPGAPYIGVTALKLYLGAEREENGKLIDSFTMPSQCPAGGFPWRADSVFHEAQPLEVSYVGACPGTQTLGETTTTLTASNTTPVVGETVTYTATVTSTEGGPAPTGHVAFWDDGVVLKECEAQPLSQGAISSTATCQVTYPTTGSHQMTADYGGDPDYNSTGSATVTVNVRSSSIGSTGNSAPAPTGGATPGKTPLSSSPPVPSAKPLTRAQLLAKALKPCQRKKPRSKRKTCEAQARKRYRPKAKGKTKDG
jgi:hypothetical protein